MYQGQRLPASRGKSASTSIVEIATTPPGRSACQIARRSEAGSGRCSMTSQIVTASNVSAGIGASSTAPQKTVPCEPRVRVLGRPARRLDAGDLEARLLGELEEGADVAADVEQLAGRRVALHVPEAVGERRDAALLLLDVAHVLDRAVQVLHLLVVRARVHVHERAAAALDDRPREPAVLLARSTCSGAAGRSRPRGSTRSARGSRRRRTADSARRCPRVLRVVPGAALASVRVAVRCSAMARDSRLFCSSLSRSFGAPRARASGGGNGPASGERGHQRPTST